MGALALLLAACGQDQQGPAWVEELLILVRGAGDPGRLALDRARGGDPCPAEWSSTYARSIDSACAAILPRDARVWFEHTGQPCWCECAAMTELLPRAMDSLHAARRLQVVRTYAARIALIRNAMQHHRSKIKDDTLVTTSGHTGSIAPRSPDPNVALRPAGVPVLPSHQPTSQGPVASTYGRCQRDEGIVPFDGECIDLRTIIHDFEAVFPIFNGEITNDPGDYPYTLNCPEQPWEEPDPDLDDEEKMEIIIPWKFIRHSKVGGELFAFMLAHEIGHGLGEVSSCTGTYEQICEGQADHWAAAWGLSMVYPHAEYIRISKAAEEQVVEYIDALGGDYPVCGNPFCDCDLFPGCGHPPAACRAQILKMGRWPTKKKPVCTDRWFQERDRVACGECPTADGS